MPKPDKIYETGRAFTYLLLKESVANDVINVSLFAYEYQGCHLAFFEAK